MDYNFDRLVAVEYLDSIIDVSDIFEKYIKLVLMKSLKNMRKTDGHSKDFLPSEEICPVSEKSRDRRICVGINFTYF